MYQRPRNVAVSSQRLSSAPAQEAGGQDDRRLHHARPRVEEGVAQDRLDDRLHLVAALGVQGLERALRRARRVDGDEVAPELRDEEGRVARVREAEANRVLLVPAAVLAEDRLETRVVPVRVEPKVDR